jgi:hypothetical protein
MLAQGNFKLHPDTIRALRGEDTGPRRPARGLWLIALALLVVFVAIIFD